MKTSEIVDLCKKHTIFSWSAQGAVDPLPVARAEGIYMYEPDGRRVLDFNSQLMCVNVGHGHPRIVEAIKKQAETLLFSWPGSATEPRARLGKKLSELLPGPINKFFFTNGGAECNETAIKIARSYTGKHKILSRYRSYHGATHGAMQLTGEPRRWATEPGAPGFIKVMDPIPYRYQFGKTDAEIVANNLTYLSEVIDCEGPQNVAAMVIEPILGTNGILPPPDGYMEGLRALLHQHDILLVVDEVMAGFGRTGRWFAHQHWDTKPDIVCMAKGITSGAIPLGAVGITDDIAKHFDDNVFSAGLTYSGHPMGIAAANAAISVLEDENLVERAAMMQDVQLKHMAAIKANHPCISGYRSIGLFGAMDFQRNSQGDPLSPGYNTTHPVVGKLLRTLRDKGLFTIARWNIFFCNPPLVITEKQLAEAYEIVDDALSVVDEVFEG